MWIFKTKTKPEVPQDLGPIQKPLNNQLGVEMIQEAMESQIECAS